MARLSDLLPRVALQAPGAPEVLLRSTVLDAARSFFRRSRAWRVTDDLFELMRTPEEVRLGVPVPGGTGVAEAISLEDTKRNLRLRSDQHRTAGISEIAVPAGLRFERLRGELAVYPLNEQVEVPDQLMAEFDEVLIAGALQRLASMPGQTWSDGGLAAYHAEVFESGIDRAAQRAADGFKAGRARNVSYGGL